MKVAAPAPQPRLWHWPAILGLDAPAIAVLWFWFFGQRLPEEPTTLPLGGPLFFAVWALYLADRVVDLWRRPPEQDRSVRHRWARVRVPWFVAAFALAALGMVLGLSGHWGEALRALLWPAAGVGLYGLLFVWRRPGHGAAGAGPRLKKVACGALFSAGVLAAMVAGQAIPVTVAFWTAGGAFAGLCAANCLLIGDREAEVYRPGVPGAPAWFRGAIALALGLALVLWLATARPLLAGGLVSSGLLLALLRGLASRPGREVEPDTVRFLADACLLPPLVWGLFF